MDRAVDFKIDSTWLRTNSRQKLDIDKIKTNTGHEVSGFLLYFIYFGQTLDTIQLNIFAKPRSPLGSEQYTEFWPKVLFTSAIGGIE